MSTPQHNTYTSLGVPNSPYYSSWRFNTWQSEDGNHQAWKETERLIVVGKDAREPEKLKMHHDRLQASKHFEDDDLWLPPSFGIKKKAMNPESRPFTPI